MEVRLFAAADAFLERAGPFLLADEARHHLLLGIAGSLIARPRDDSVPPYLATVERRGVVIGVAIQTSPSNLILTNLITRPPLPRQAKGPGGDEAPE